MDDYKKRWQIEIYQSCNLRRTLFWQKFGELSRAPESSEQFVWLNRRDGETETPLSRPAITPSIRTDLSQDEVS
jgi:hypothetical protein